MESTTSKHEGGGEGIEVKQEPQDEEAPGKAKFHVNMGLIPAANLNDETDELKGLDLEVFNQEELEQGLFITV